MRETTNVAGGREAVLVFIAMPGERNDVVISFGGDSTLVLRDDGAPVVPGPGCVTIDDHAVRCAQQPYVMRGVTLALLATAHIDAGDGDDAVRTRSFNDVAFGSDGADALTGPGTLVGGPGNDVLTNTTGPPQPCTKDCSTPTSVLAGGPGDDVLHGGGNTDLLSGDGDGPDRRDATAGRGNDIIEGGGGADQLSYEGRSVPVRVDLSGATASGSVGERDRIVGVEHVIGGDHADVLLGTAHANEMWGGSGDDELRGLGGPDALDGGPGADVLRGGDGRDKMRSDHPGDVIDAGAGDDRISHTTTSRRCRRPARCTAVRALTSSSRRAASGSTPAKPPPPASFRSGRGRSVRGAASCGSRWGATRAGIARSRWRCEAARRRSLAAR